ncbi:MAG: glycosyltransferase family 1 protein [Phascolarctobacterium sp.]|nr:MAG: glycosyltransferase family 1 protein [Phascolarctobacterium sp.]
MNKILVITTDYPNNAGKVSLQYVHTRNVEYLKFGITVTVLNFAAKENYEIDGIRVITLKTYQTEKNNFNLLISHAPNLRQHLVFLLQYGKYFQKYIFFFHGHEVLRCNKVYPKPYSYISHNLFLEYLRDIYDIIKLKVWHYYFLLNLKKSNFIFVSKWMLNEFEKWVKIDRKELSGRYEITYNSVGQIFEIEQYNTDVKKIYDFITIRSNMDGSKYCIDVVNKIAEDNPNYKFLIVGRGKFFKYNQKSKNVCWMNKNLRHNEMIDLLNKSRCALMPTRTDAQGVMACEMATFGIPLVTTDLPVCHEVFDTFVNVQYIANNRKINCKDLLNKVNFIFKKNCEYFIENTIIKEIKLLK